jgi:hypothetical protein
MLSTKDMTTGGGKLRPLMGPGNNVVRINSISMDKTPWDAEAYQIHLHVESQPITGEFEGFLRDQNNESLGRYDGQIARVRMAPFPYKDATLDNGREISKDQEILKGMIFVSEVVGGREKLDAIEANTIEDFVSKCNELFSNSEFFNVCLASREWENKEGYINNDLYFPKLSREGVPMEALDVATTRLITFDKNVHVRSINKTSNGTSPAAPKTFEPVTSNGASDFEL